MTAAHVLQRQVLVLNRGWNPLRVTSVQNAIGLVAKGSALIIDPKDASRLDLVSWDAVSRSRAKHGDDLIRSSRMALIPPEVILLNTYEGMGQKSVIFSRKNLFKRDKYTCQYCGIQPGPQELTVDHVLPRSKGGKSTWENSVLACVECNKRKADKTPEQAKMKLRKKPHKPSWKHLMQVSPRERLQSWEQFVSNAYWEVELEP